MVSLIMHSTISTLFLLFGRLLYSTVQYSTVRYFIASLIFFDKIFCHRSDLVAQQGIKEIRRWIPSGQSRIRRINGARAEQHFQIALL